MRMARAFIASVPLGVVLIAAVIVPVAVTPGTFGFQSWPSSHGEQVTDRPVRAVPDRVELAKAGPNGTIAKRTVLADAKTGRTQARHAAAGTTPSRRTANLVMTPRNTGSGRGGSDRYGSHHGGNGNGNGSGPGHGSTSHPTPS